MEKEKLGKQDRSSSGEATSQGSLEPPDLEQAGKGCAREPPGEHGVVHPLPRPPELEGMQLLL